MYCLNNRRRVKQNAYFYEELKLEHEWLLCRKIIVFAGSLLSIIYALAILTTTQWLKVESIKLAETLPETDMSSVKNDYFAAVHIMVIGFIGSISPFIKSKKIGSFGRASEPDNNNRSVENSENLEDSRSRASTTFPFFDWSQKLNRVRNWIKTSPLFSINAILIATILPIEFVITINVSQNLVKSDNDSNNHICVYCLKVKETVHRLSLCLTVLYVSLMLIQICVFLYIIDLLQSQVNRKSFQRRMSPILRNKTQRVQSPIRKWMPNSEQKLHLQNEKSHHFFQFLRNDKHMNRTPRRLPEIPSRSPNVSRHTSEASTIEIDEVFQRQSTSSDHYEYVGALHHDDYDI